MNPYTIAEVKEQFDTLPEGVYSLVTAFNIERHRGNKMLAVVSPTHRSFYIDGMACVVLSLVDKPGWLIVANYYGDDAKFTDIGPFNDLHEALTYVHLRKDVLE